MGSMNGLFGDAKEIQFMGQTIKLNRLTLGGIFELEEWLDSKKGAAFNKNTESMPTSRLPDGIRSKALSEIALHQVKWQDALGNARGQLYVVYVGIKQAMLKATNVMTLTYDQVVAGLSHWTTEELELTAIWLCGLSHLIEDKTRPLDSASTTETASGQ